MKGRFRGKRRRLFHEQIAVFQIAGGVCISWELLLCGFIGIIARMEGIVKGIKEEELLKAPIV
jgi:hypothetical protein